MRKWTVAVLLVAIAGLIGVARAEDKPNPTGTWKWTVKFGDQEREMAVKLKAEKGKLTGHFVGPDGKETPIEDGTCKDGDVAFKVTRERDGNKFTIKFTGKVSGDTLKGKTEFERGGETRSRDWEAKRAKS
jgi:hypothetical protein